jgi:hypothetical protein
MSFVNGVRDAFPEGADLLYSKRALHGIRDDGCPHANLGTALGEWRGRDPIGPMQVRPPQEDSRAVGRFLATEHKAPVGAGVEIQRDHPSCA